ncbi:MAG: sensor histidine kinase [Bacteroidales bacterium]|nr:sensor histidine kinase [Bacteroidales bacterium]
MIDAQEMERKRIAADLHDSVGQMLSLSKLHMSEISEVIAADLPSEKDTAENAMRLIDEACQEVRNISHNLMPGALIKLGLVPAVRELIRKAGHSKTIRFNFSSDLDEKRLDEKVEISLYRIVQEIISNILKHANASEVTITIKNAEENSIQLNISDNGNGFDTAILDSVTGIGWKNIYSRLAMMNGKMNIQSQLNSGTSITIRIFL